jgi:very-short-patch-repair endonuclease
MLRWLGRMAFVLAVLLGVVLAGVWIAANATLSHVEAATVQAVPVRFDGRALAAISDADMVATAYANGVFKQIPGRRDTLSLLPLPLSSSDTIRREVFVSNSVTSWPQLMAASPNGRKLYVAEVAGEVEDRVERVASVNALPEGRVLSVVDVASGLVEGRVEVGQNPLVVSVSPDGRFVAVGSSEPNRQLVQAIENPANTRADQDAPIIAVKPVKRFFNASETDAYRSLRQALYGQSLVVLPKVRLLDLVQPLEGEMRLGTLNRLRGMHVDFVVVSVPEFRPLVALELDGWSHGSQRQQARDAVKDEALRQAGLPIMRVQSRDMSSKERVLAILEPHVPIQTVSLQA